MRSMLHAQPVDRPAAIGTTNLQLVTQRRHSEPPTNGTAGVVGLGYVGLPTTLALIEAGISVVGYDLSEQRLAAIKAQQVDLLPADNVRLERCLGSERLVLTTDAAELRAVSTVMVCVPTPVDVHQVPDLSALAAACSSVVACAVEGQTIVLTSTTYVGCTRDLLVEPLRQRGLIAGRDVFVAFSPERIDPGVAAHVPENTPRVIGGVTTECANRAVEIFSRISSQVHVVSAPETAELTKLLENTFRAVNIALANEFSDVARKFEIDPIEVIRAAATKPYGFMPFYPGPGAGGHCIPCDPHYLLWQLKAARISPAVTAAAMMSLAARPHSVVHRAHEVLAESGRTLRGARVLVLGVAYKPDVADVRESPALEIIEELDSLGAEVAFNDLLVETIRISRRVLIREPEPAATAWDLIILHTAHTGADHSWLADAHAVLDTTYRLVDVPHRHLL